MKGRHVILSEATLAQALRARRSAGEDLYHRKYETLPGTDPPGQVSVATNAPSE